MNKKSIILLVVISLLIIIPFLSLAKAEGYLPLNFTTYILHNESDLQYSSYKQMKNISTDLSTITSEREVLNNDAPVCWSAKWLANNWTNDVLVNGTWTFNIYTNCSASFSSGQYWLQAEFIKRNATGEFIPVATPWSTFSCGTGAPTLKTWSYNLLYNFFKEVKPGEKIGAQICVEVTASGAANKYSYMEWEGATSSNVLFPFSLLDNTPPNLTIISPSNQSYNNATILVNISSQDANLQATWWYNGSANLTYTSALNYVFPQGSNTITAYANDTLANLNFSQVSFFVDSINPDIYFGAGTQNSSQTINMGEILVNVTAIDLNPNNITIKLYNSTSLINSTFSLNSNYFINFSGLLSGLYYFNATAYDKLGNYNSTETRNVTIILDIIPPNLTIISPLNTTYANSSIFLNYSVSDNFAVNSCWYSLDSGANTTLANCLTLLFSSLSDGGHKIIVYANDTLGNLNSSSISFSIDTTPPQYSNIQSSTPATYSPTLSFFNVTWQDNSGINTVLFESNFSGQAVNYSMYNLGGGVYSFNATMPAGTFYWKSYANDSYGNLNASQLQTFTISQNNTYTITLNFNSNPVTYPLSTTATGSGCPSELSCQLFNNVTGLLTNPYTTTHSAGYFNYTYNTTGNINYSTISTSAILQVNKGTGQITLKLNGASDNLIIEYGNQTNASATSSTQQITILYQDGIDKTSTENSVNVTIASGYYNYTAIASSNQNYSQAIQTYFLNITKAAPTLSLLLNGSDSDLSLNINENLEINASSILPANENIELYEDSSLISSGSSISVNKNYLSLGDRVWEAVIQETQNYTSKNISHTVSVIDIDAPHFSNLLTSPSSPTTYSSGKNFQFNSTWTDNIAIDNVIFTFNNRNYSFSNSEIQKNGNEYSIILTDLASGTYSYKWYANDSSGNLVATPQQTYDIEKGITALFLTFMPNNNIAYGTTSTVSCSANNIESNPILTRNTNSVTNPDIAILASGLFNYACTSTATQNYTSSSTTGTLTVNKAAPVFNLTLNNQDGDIILPSSGGDVNIIATLVSPSSGIINLTIDGNLVDSSNTPIQNTTFFSVQGSHTISVFYAGNENYSYGYYTHLVSVSSPPAPNPGGGGGGGGSGGGSSGPLLSGKLQLTAIPNLIVNPGDTRKITLNVKNSGGIFLNDCKLKGTGEYALWISSDDVKGLSAGESYDFIFSLNIPVASKTALYNLGINVECKESYKSTNFIAEILEKKLQVKIIDVKSNRNNLGITYSLEELSGTNQDVNIQILLLGDNNERIAETSETRKLAANTKQNFDTSLNVSSSLKGTFNLLINANSNIASTFVQEEAILRGSAIGGLAILNGTNTDLIFTIILIAVFVVFALFLVRRMIKFRNLHKVKKIESNVVHLPNPKKYY